MAQPSPPAHADCANSKRDRDILADMAELVLRLREREMNRVPILTTRLTVGRDTASDLVIDNAGVSRTHAVITFEDNTYYVDDADSQNGITVNGRATKQAALQYGDVIGIGKFEIELVQSGDFPTRAGNSAADALPARNVMRTIQMDAAATARLREEVAAKLAAKKDGAVRVSSRPSSSAPRAGIKPASAPPPAVGGSDVLAVLKVVLIVLAGVAALVTAVLLVL
jgi:predicted component of type VI protein secretion system